MTDKKLREKFKVSLGKLVEAAKEVTEAEQAFCGRKPKKPRKLISRIRQLEEALKKAYWIISEYEMFNVNPDTKKGLEIIEKVMTWKDKKNGKTNM